MVKHLIKSPSPKKNRAPTSPLTQLSEASSYRSLALSNFSPPLPTSRVLLEERALDSYHNILFSLVLFWKTYGAWPARLTIVSHAFKRTRLVEGHCKAIGFPLDRVGYVGINPPSVEEKTGSMEGNQLALGQWEEDPHGVGEDLASKRRARNHWGVEQRLFDDDVERERAGVDTWRTEDGGESLVEGGRRPWANI